MNIQHSPEKTWRFRDFPTNISQEWISQTATKLGISADIGKILALRGFTDESEINTFLSPSLSQLPRPQQMKGMADALSILLKSLKAGRPVTVYGDFDADGVTSTALLYLFFSELAVPLRYYIPDRLTEGYGLNTDAVRKIYEANIKQWGEQGVLITADCGISDGESVSEARKMGFQVIITDHHKPPAILPKADAILNPLQPGCSFPCKNLAGVGVAFYLILGLRSELIENGHWPEDKIPNLKSYMDLAAIGTVADQVAVTGCNRIIVKAGLEVLNQCNRVGLQKLIEKTRGNESEIRAEDIAFRMAPRINAIGRIGPAQKAVELLSTRILSEAEMLADELEEANNTRKSIETGIFDEATRLVTAETLNKTKALLIYKNDWHQGVLGIVASRLTDKYNRPTILLTDCSQADAPESKKMVKGSGRSVEGLDLHRAVSSCHEWLERFGGHEGAVGLTLAFDNIESFRQQFDQAVGMQIEKKTTGPNLDIDMEITFEALSDKNFLATYRLLAPFGSGNPEPVFFMAGQNMTNLRTVGTNHLRFTVGSQGTYVNGIGFGFGNFITTAQNSKMDIVFALRLNSYMGQDKWEIHVLDLRPTASH